MVDAREPVKMSCRFLVLAVCVGLHVGCGDSEHAAARYAQLGEGAIERETMRYDAPQPFPTKAKATISPWAKENGVTGAWEVQTRRGFVESAIVEAGTGADLLHAGALHPIVALSIRGPSFGQPARAPQALLDCPWMSRLRHLALHQFAAKDEVTAALRHAAHLTSLETLHLASCKVDNARAKTLSEATLPALIHLHFFDNTFRAAGLKHLLARFAATLCSPRVIGHVGAGPTGLGLPTCW